MKQFKTRMNLLHFTSFQSFIELEGVGEGDFILTTEPIHKAFIAPIGLPCETLFLERYGQGEPSTVMVDSIRTDVPADTRRIIAIGGGSVIDAAKLLALDTGAIEELFLGKAAYRKAREVVAVPTTCGTGSEVTNAVACELVSLQTKRGLSLDEFYPDKAALIPELIMELPYRFFATSSIDALIHAVESYLSPKANPHTELFSVQAIRMILAGYRHVIEAGRDKWNERAADFLTASNFAGVAFSNAGCAAVHALSYPLGGKYHIPHGEANQLMFAEVMRTYKAKQPAGKLEQLEALFAQCLGTVPGEGLEAAIGLLDKVLPRKPLREYGVQMGEFPGFAAGVIAGQQRLLTNNYTALTQDDIVRIYQTCF